MAEYRFNPVIVDAVQFTEENIKSGALDHVPMYLGISGNQPFATVSLPLGEVRVSVEDWIVTTPNGKLLVVTRDTFHLLFEKVW